MTVMQTDAPATPDPEFVQAVVVVLQFAIRDAACAGDADFVDVLTARLQEWDCE